MTASESLIKDYADLGVSCGYIGGVHTWGDDRGFRVFTKLSTRPNASACDVSVYVFDVPHDHKGVWKEPITYDTPLVRAKLDHIRERFNKGELYEVKP